MGYEYHLDSDLVIPTREMAQTSGFDPTLKIKTCFDCKMFDIANWVFFLYGEDGLGGTPSHEALLVSSQGAFEIFSVIRQPPSLVEDHVSSPRVVAKSHKCDERCRPSSPRPQCMQIFTDHKRPVVGQGKKGTHKCSRAEGGIPGLEKVQGPVSKQTRRNQLSRDV